MRNDVEMQMRERVEAGCDPLSGRPMQITGAVHRDDDGSCRDEAGVPVTVSEYGDWIPVHHVTLSSE